VFDHPGLHVADGSVMPGPVGPNPSLTIAALADRFADALLEGAEEPRRHPVRRAGSAEGAPPAATVQQMEPIRQTAANGAVALAFTEEMKGFADFELTEYDAAYRAGKAAKQSLMFHLTITANDVERFIRDPEHEANVEGWVGMPALGGRLPVEGGHFNLFVDRAAGGTHKRMHYRLFFRDAAQHPLTLVGFKEVRDEPGFDVWRDTSTLYTRLLGGHVTPEQQPDAPVVATGVLRILKRDFARQLTTFRVTPARRVDALARFGSLFAGQLLHVYAKPAR
jgi:cholesterol oxidase